MTEPIKVKNVVPMPSAETVARELSTVKSIDDFFGKSGVFSRLFAPTIEKMLEAELTSHVGYEKYEAKGRNSGNSRNGSYQRTVKTSVGETEIEVPRDRNGSYEPTILKKYQTSSNEIEDKIIGMYGKGMTVRDIQDQLSEMYGIEVSGGTISTITDKVLPLIIDWQDRPLENVYPFVFLDAIHIRLKRDSKIVAIPIYVCVAISQTGVKDVLGHWIGDGKEGANFWLSVVTDLKNRGVQDILIACVDGLTGFSDAIHAVYPQTEVQRCIVHQIRNSLKYVSWKDKDPFMKDLMRVYQAPTVSVAEVELLKLSELWGKKYALSVRSWENNWNELTTYFGYTPEIRRIMYTTNGIESYNRQLRKVTKTKSVFPTDESVKKMLYLAYRDVKKKWDKAVPHWPEILNQLVIKFEGRLSV